VPQALSADTGGRWPSATRQPPGRCLALLRGASGCGGGGPNPRFRWRCV
jgi:hypothetical protein